MFADIGLQCPVTTPIAVREVGRLCPPMLTRGACPANQKCCKICCIPLTDTLEVHRRVTSCENKSLKHSNELIFVRKDGQYWLPGQLKEERVKTACFIKR